MLTQTATLPGINHQTGTIQGTWQAAALLPGSLVAASQEAGGSQVAASRLFVLLLKSPGLGWLNLL